MGKAVLSVVDPAGKGKVIMFCKPRELVAKLVKVWTPSAVEIEIKGPEVAKVWVLEVEPLREVRPVPRAEQAQP